MAALACSQGASTDNPGGGPAGHVTVVGNNEADPGGPTQPPHTTTPRAFTGVTATPLPTLPVLGSPTPDATRIAVPGHESQGYTVQAGDTLGAIAGRFGVSVGDLKTANGLNSDAIEVGRQLTIPPSSLPVASAYKIISDSELVNGPTLVGFDTEAAAAKFGGRPDAEDKLIYHITSGERVKFPDGHEEEHKKVKTKDPAEQRNLVQWILSLEGGTKY